MSFRDGSENAILDYMLNDGSAPTASTHLGGLTASPGDAGAVTEVQTPGSNGYARDALVGADWNAAASGSKSNSADVEFGPATSDWASGGTQVTDLMSVDASTAGTAQLIFALTTAVNVLNTQTLRFTGGSPGNIVATLD